MSDNGPSGGTGFLFGNIDRQGRLEEEYLSDEAKDNLDHIGTKVTEKHRELSEIREALPGDKNAESDDDYDNDGSAQPSPIPQRPVSDGLYEDVDSADDDGDDVDDVQLLGDHDRSQLAKRALATGTHPGHAADEDDENYDDDDDDRPVASSFPANSPATQSASSPAPHALLPSAPIASSPSAQTHPQRQQPSARPIPSPTPSPLIKPPLLPLYTPVSEAEQENPILFSEIFARPPRRLNFSRRARSSLGLVVAPQPLLPPCPDDSDILNRPTTPPIVDPIALTLASDEPFKKLLYPTAPEIRARSISVVQSRQYREASLPLVLSSESGTHAQPSQNPKEVAIPLAPFQVFPWEKGIGWGDSDHKGDDPAQWYSPSLEKTSNTSVQISPADNSDDDDDFEDPVFLNPVSSTIANPSKAADKQDDSDDDEDMEWEDGHLSDSNLLSEVKNNVPEKVATAHKAPSTPTVQVGTGPTNDNDKNPGIVMKELDITVPKHTDPVGDAYKNKLFLKDGPVILAPNGDETGDIVKTIIAPNSDLMLGAWSRGIIWDSESEVLSDGTETDDRSYMFGGAYDNPILLDMNDPNMVFEHLSEHSVENTTVTKYGKPSTTGPLSNGKMETLLMSSGAQVHQILQADRFNISNDLYYASGTSQHFKLDRGLTRKGLQNATPANRIQTTPSALTDSELLSFRRPKLSHDRLPRDVNVSAVRRKRVKGGTAQIAGQIPKKKHELRCSEKDAYRVSIFEYALERQPCLLPIPGMASRICTYARKNSAEEVQSAINAAAGTADADTIFMFPDDLPPLASGNVEVNNRPLSVIESQLYVAPCATKEAASTDFLLVRHEDSMFVREIDSLISVGITEPKVEVMSPNTERYKKYSRERMVLWVMREFQRMKKEIGNRKKDIANRKKKGKGIENMEMKVLRSPPYIEKDEIYKEFPRRRTYPETGLLRALKELSRFQNGKYMQDMIEETKYGAREQDLLRILTATETAAFESMESGWEQILDRGLLNFTHPSGQGNILAAAEADRSGLEAGPAVGKYIKSHLLKSPWYRSQNILAAHRLQRKDLLQALALARIVNDLKEGGEVMEAKLLTLAPMDMNNVLTQVYRYNSKKIPIDTEEKRNVIREVCQKKGKGAPSPEVSDYPVIISTVLKKHRDAGLSKGAAIAAMGTSMAGGTFLGIPLPIQRAALEDGVVDGLPAEEDDFLPDKDTESILAEYVRNSGAKEGNENGVVNKRLSKKGRPSSTDGQKNNNNCNGTERSGLMSSRLKKDERGARGTSSGTFDGQVGDIDAGSMMRNESYDRNGHLKGTASGEGEEPKKKKKVTRLKVTKKVTGADGIEKSVVTYVTDDKEINRLLEKKKGNKDGGSSKKNSADEPSASGGLKIAIDLKRLQGGKAGFKKKKTSGSEKTKSKAKGSSKAVDGRDAGTSSKGGEKKGQIGKIKINTRQLHMDKERAALKRKRSQYSDDVDVRTKKAAKTSRKKRNGTVELNGILERVENIVRTTEGYVVPGSVTEIKIARLKDGESPPPGAVAKILANPQGTGLDFTAPVDTKTVASYKQVVKEPMYLNLIRSNCKQMKYAKSIEFMDDMRLMMNNARAFNQKDDVQWVVRHAELLYDVALEQVSRRADEIRMAEDMVKVEKVNAKSGMNSNVKSKKKSKGNQGGKKGCGKKKGQVIKDHITIVDNDDKDNNGPNEVVDLSGNDGREVLEVGTDEVQEVTGVSSSSVQPMLDAGMTDDIFAMDVAEDDFGRENGGGDNLVLDLDDMGGMDGL